jgi:hypothetical protein
LPSRRERVQRVPGARAMRGFCAKKIGGDR